MITHPNSAALGGGVFKFGLKVDPYKYQFYMKKWPIHISIGPILGLILSKITHFSKIFLNLSQFWLKVGKILKIDPFIYQILCFIRCHSYTKRLILLPMLAAHPRRFLYTEYPPLGLAATTSHGRCISYWSNCSQGGGRVLTWKWVTGMWCP